jgi:hypothetical protein
VTNFANPFPFDFQQFFSNMMMGSIYFNGQLVKEFTTEFPVKNGLKRNKFFGGGVLVLAQQQVST